MPAAIFDLDRTLLPGSSTPVFTAHLAKLGLGPSVKIPLQNQFFRLFESHGETMPAMQLAKLAARANKGWPVTLVEEAATHAAEELVTLLQPHAPALLEQHRSAGHTLVLATTSPSAFVDPLARLLGFDATVSTEWASTDGRYNGALDGPFLWGKHKMQAVVAWAEATNADLSISHAYSDSFYDRPLLEAVGHPHAVNPDPKLQQVAADRAWPIHHLDSSPKAVSAV